MVKGRQSVKQPGRDEVMGCRLHSIGPVPQALLHEPLPTHVKLSLQPP